MTYIIRFVLFIPLAFITYQVLMLRKILHSTAWRLIAAGFVTFAVMSGVQIVFRPQITVRLVISLIGYGFIAAGFHYLRDDLCRVLKRKERP